ncbi:MAG TPA: hypothetical protein VFD38_00485 [Myxococcaceae bacterium]|nr:hypothetical protein [Myxococcaceae bacterium]
MELTRQISISQAVAAGQGAYFLLAGVWPLVSLKTFYAVTGPKRDGWLVQTVGSLIASIGTTLLLGARRRTVSSEVRWLGASSAAALMAVDVMFVRSRRIPRIYLADAALELGLLAGWALATMQEARRHPPGQFETRSEKASWTASGKTSCSPPGNSR